MARPPFHKRLAQAARAAWRIMARYEGATRQPFRSQLPGANLQSARYDQRPSTRMELQKKARYFERNSALVNRLSDLFEQYCVGPGIQFSPMSSDEVWNRAASTYWAEWKPFADILTRQSFDMLQGVIARALFIDGEIFILLTRGTGGRPRIQLIEAHRCATPPDRTAEEGKTIIDGVAVNEIGRPDGYWFAEDNAATNLMGQPDPASYRLVEAINVIHVFEPGRAGQYRGLPFLYPVMADLHDLDDLQLLEMKAARDAAEVSNVLINKAGEVSIADLVATGGNAATNAPAGPVSESTAGGRTVVLATGDDFKQFRSDRPSVATRDYWVALEAKVCAGVGIPRQLVYPESIQGTVERAVLDMAAFWFRLRSAVLAEKFRRVWEYTLAIGSRTELALSDPPANWRTVKAQAPRAVNVDVGRNSNAMLAELAAGVRTRQQIWAEDGRDWQLETRQKAAEEKFINELALEFGLPPERIASSALPPATTESAVEEEPTPVTGSVVAPR